MVTQRLNFRHNAESALWVTRIYYSACAICTKPCLNLRDRLHLTDQDMPLSKLPQKPVPYINALIGWALENKEAIMKDRKKSCRKL